jgi:hypothetical protein
VGDAADDLIVPPHFSPHQIESLVTIYLTQDEWFISAMKVLLIAVSCNWLQIICVK